MGGIGMASSTTMIKEAAQMCGPISHRERGVNVSSFIKKSPSAVQAFVLVSVDAVSGSLGVLIIILVKVIYISCQGDLDTRSLQY